MTILTQKPTLNDVARVTGVSTATVSRCLNAEDKVSEATREKVMKAVEDLGYTPNFGARVMAGKRTYTIGAIIPTMENAIFARGLQAFQETLHELGYNLLVSSSAYQPELEAEQVKSLIARGADGLLLIGYERDPAIYEYLERRGIPVLLAWAFLANRPHASVGFDNRASMSMLTDRVISMGHRKIAVISGIVEGNDRAFGRLAGIKDSVAAHGMDPDAMQVIETPYEIENGAAAFRKIMQVEDRPSVVMCGNDVLAAGALFAAKEMKIDVPDEVSVTGFDDIKLAGILHPTLTTVHVPHRAMGKAAAVGLIDMVEHRSSGFVQQLDVSIAMRGSLKPV